MPRILVKAGMPSLADDNGFQCQQQVEGAKAGTHRFGRAADMVRHRGDQIAVGKRCQRRLGKGDDQDDAALQAQIGQRLVNRAKRPSAPGRTDLVIGAETFRRDRHRKDGMIGAGHADKMIGEDGLDAHFRPHLAQRVIVILAFRCEA